MYTVVKLQNSKGKKGMEGKERLLRRNDNHLAANSSAKGGTKDDREYLKCLVAKSRILYPN